MITKIGIVAGEIWSFLDKYGQVSLDRLVIEIDKPRELTLMSLGWLSREGHVLVREDGLEYQISLRDKKSE